MKIGTTLHLTLPFGKTIGLALAMLILVVSTAEVVARSSWVRSRFPFPGVNSPNPDLDEGLRQLDWTMTEDGRVDCIVLGTSMVRTDFDPSTFKHIYQQQAGADLKCLSFGIGGMVIAQAGDLAQVLSQTYHPSMLIVATSARDFSDQVAQANILNANEMIHVPWVRYRLGDEFSFEGWLIDNSYAYHYSLGLRSSLRDWAPVPQAAPTRLPVDVSRLPDPVLERGLYEVFADFYVSNEGLKGLEKILALKEQGIEVVVVEMPVHPTYLYFFGRGEEDMQAFRDAVAYVAAAHEVVFWPVDPSLVIPDSAWMDRNHLNAEGRVIFTEWLAHKVVDGHAQGLIHIPEP